MFSTSGWYLPQTVWLAVFFREPRGCFGIADDGFGFRIPLNRLSGSHGDVTEMADDRRTMPDADVRSQRISRLDAFQESATRAIFASEFTIGGTTTSLSNSGGLAMSPPRYTKRFPLSPTNPVPSSLLYLPGPTRQPFTVTLAEHSQTPGTALPWRII